MNFPSTFFENAISFKLSLNECLKQSIKINNAFSDAQPNVRNTPQLRPEVAAEKATVIAAHEQAEKDMEKEDDLNPDADISNDLDEGEMARFKQKDESRE